jgi:hypothetical protein
MSDQHSIRRSSGVENLMRFNPYTASAGLTPQVIDAAMRRAHVERARSAVSMSAALWRGVRTAGQALLRGIARAQQRRAAQFLLRNLDPHLRDDIGLGPGQPRELVEELLSTPPEHAGAGSTRHAAAPAAPQQHRRAA